MKTMTYQNINIKELKKLIANKEPVIIKNLLGKNEVQNIIQACLLLKAKTEPSVPVVSFGMENYHRIDDNVKLSTVKSRLHLYSLFYWNKETDNVSRYFKRIMKIRNLLSDLPEDYAVQNNRDGMISIPCVQQYPRGGGYMQEHIDPDVGQKAIISVLLKKEFSDGGLCYMDGDKKVFVDKLMNVGDAFIFNPKISHAVEPIDKSAKLDWNKNDGRWMCFSILVSLQSLNRK